MYDVASKAESAEELEMEVITVYFVIFIEFF